MKVLVVDDEKIMCVSLRHALRDAGYHAAACGSAAEALELLSQERFDVAVVDMMMPGMNGLELLGIVKREHPEVEVIMMTAYGTDQTGAEVREKGARLCLEKPFDTSELLQLLADP